MRFFYQDPRGQVLGPYTLDELRQLHLSGVLGPETLLVAEGDTTTVAFREVWARWGAPPIISPGGPPHPEPAPSPLEAFAHQTGEDLRALTPHLLVPLDEFKSLRWLENRTVLTIAGVGLLPLVILALTLPTGNLESAYWLVAFYFSVLWGCFFFYVFPAPQVRLWTSTLCFFGTGIISITLLLLAYRLPPLNQAVVLVRADHLLVRWPGFVFGVGLPEEACKAVMVLYIWQKFGPFQPRTMLFYGLMAGLGFGIYEGVTYQWSRNWTFSQNPAEYYLLNVIRLTTLPFLHAIWTGIAGYFIGFAGEYPHRKRGLLIVAIGVPAFLHGSYNTFGPSIPGFAFALMSVLALVLYMSKSVEFEKALRGQAGR
jgi:RsiW-degrading membrane proteinase PrsW (M82 family)